MLLATVRGMTRVTPLVLCVLCSELLVAQVPPSGDTYVSSSSAKANFGPAISLVVAPLTNSYVQFNLSGVPAGASIEKASLRLYVDAVGAKGSFDVYELNTAWDENPLKPGPASHVEPRGLSVQAAQQGISGAQGLPGLPGAAGANGSAGPQNDGIEKPKGSADISKINSLAPSGANSLQAQA